MSAATTPRGNAIQSTSSGRVIRRGPLPYNYSFGYKTSDIVAVSVFQLTPDAIVVPADSPYKTLKDLIDAAKAKPGSVTMSGSGTNTGPHLSATTFNKLAGIKTTYVPFAGTTPAVVAMLGKQVNAAMTFTTAAIQQGDKVRMLAVALEKRLDSHPNVPTFKELDSATGRWDTSTSARSSKENARWSCPG